MNLIQVIKCYSSAGRWYGSELGWIHGSLHKSTSRVQGQNKGKILLNFYFIFLHYPLLLIFNQLKSGFMWNIQWEQK